MMSFSVKKKQNNNKRKQQQNKNNTEVSFEVWNAIVCLMYTTSFEYNVISTHNLIQLDMNFLIR